MAAGWKNIELTAGRFSDFFTTIIEEFSDYTEEWRKDRLWWELDMLEAEEERDLSVYHPSALGQLGRWEGPRPAECPRAIYYSVSEGRLRKEFDSRTLRIFEAGKDAHARTQFVLMTVLGEDFYPEQKVAYDDKRYPDLRIRGSCDGVYELPSGMRRGVEIKTANSWALGTAKKRAQLPFHSHLTQGAVYTALLGLDYMHYIYENKNTQELVEIEVSREELLPLWRNVLKWLEYIEEQRQQGKLPMAAVIGARCKRCVFFGICRPWEEEEGKNEPEVLQRARLEYKELLNNAAGDRRDTVSAIVESAVSADAGEDSIIPRRPPLQRISRPSRSSRSRGSRRKTKR